MQKVKHRKQRVGLLILLGCSHIGLGAFTVVTNPTRVIKYVKKAHSVTSCIYRCAHDASEVPIIAINLIGFGEYIPSCSHDGYPLFNVSSGALD